MIAGVDTCDIYLNDIAYWQNIPARVWDYTIGGYQVIKKWLSYREEPLLSRPLKPEEAAKLPTWLVASPPSYSSNPTLTPTTKPSKPTPMTGLSKLHLVRYASLTAPYDYHRQGKVRSHYRICDH